MLGYALLRGESLAIGDGKTLLMLVIYGVMVQFVGWLLVNRSIGQISLGLAGLILLLEPVIYLFRRCDVPGQIELGSADRRGVADGGGGVYRVVAAA